MADYGYAGRISPIRPLGDVIRVKIEQPYIAGAQHWRTVFQFPNEDQFAFEVPEATVKSRLQFISRDLKIAVRSGNPSDVVVANLHEIGRRLTDLLLVRGDQDTTSQERNGLIEELRATDAPILFDFNLPVPIELLVFEDDIGGIGDFATMLGARPACWFSNRPPRGKTVGAGLALFHDDQLRSVSSGAIRTAIKVAFDDIDAHDRMLDSALGAVKTEIDRLFYGDSAWAHFQCHNEGGHSLQLTRSFLAGNDWFTRESREMAAILLNCCQATERTECAPASEAAPSGSWGDHFAGKLHIPAVIGPFTDVRDDETIAFANLFYGELRGHPTIFEAFCAAKRRLLEAGDFAGVLYRFVGARSLVAPLQKKQGLRAMAFSDAA